MPIWLDVIITRFGEYEVAPAPAYKKDYRFYLMHEVLLKPFVMDRVLLLRFIDMGVWRDGVGRRVDEHLYRVEIAIEALESLGLRDEYHALTNVRTP